MVKQLRRLDVPRPQDPYRRAQRGVLRHVALSEEDFRALAQAHPAYVVEEGEAVLIGEPRRDRIDLHYAFPDRDAFARTFPDAFQRLAAAVRQDDAPLGFRLRLADRPSRPYVEPVLFAQAFEVSREWLQMALPELPAGRPAGARIAPGYVLRPVRAGDAAAIVELEELAFPDPQLTVEAVRETLTASGVYRVLEDTARSAVVGSLLAERRAAGAGHIVTVAVHPEYQRRGLGEALVRWALGWFRQEGLRRATLTVNTENAPAIALYRKLGFAPGQAGLDYVRPSDEEEVRRVLEKRRGSVIKFGGWR